MSQNRKKNEDELTGDNEESEPIIPDITEKKLINYKPRERGKIAIVFVCGYLFFITMSFVIFLFGKITLQELLSLFQTISAVMGGIIGTVVGFYFRSEEKS